MTEHKCKKDELKWDPEPENTGDCITYAGKCPTCNKVYEQVFTMAEENGLWDVEAEKYIYGM